DDTTLPQELVDQPLDRGHRMVHDTSLSAPCGAASPRDGKACPVLRFSPKPPQQRAPLLWMVMLAVAALLGRSAQARSVAASTGGEVMHNGHHNCRCAQRCRGAACCCKHDRPAAPKPAAPTSSTVIATGPCLAAWPCDGGAPVPTTSGPPVR